MQTFENLLLKYYSTESEFPKDVGPPDKSGENLHGPMNAVSPPDQMSDNSWL